MRTTIRTTIATLGALAALGLSACGDDEDDSAGDDTTSSSEQTDEEAAEGEESGAEDSDVFEVELGDCIGAFNAEEEVTDVSVAPCDEKHDQEVFTIAEVPDGEFPGSDSFQDQVENDCIPEFETFVGIPYADSELEIKWLEPTESSWSEGDRELVCTVYDESGPVTGTLEGAER